MVDFDQQGKTRRVCHRTLRIKAVGMPYKAIEGKLYRVRGIPQRVLLAARGIDIVGRDRSYFFKVQLRKTSHNRFRRFGLAWEQAVFVEKLDHEAVEQPGLLDLTGVAGAGQNL
jgi:hypothetical protein